MGMYDEVMIGCPECKHVNTEQSKGGDCELKTYSIKHPLPLGVLGGLGDHPDGNMWCEKCKQPYHIRIVEILIVGGERNEDND